MPRSIKTAWGEKNNSAPVKNAYHHIKENDVIINLQGETIGTASTYKSRPTAATRGSVQLTNDNNEIIWISGELLYFEQNKWVITSNTKITIFVHNT